jgi:hypothetical protein
MITTVLQSASLERDAHIKSQQALLAKHVLLMGARGRLGETLLNDLLAKAHYTKVYVLADQRLEMGLQKLNTCTWNEAVRVDHVVINMTPHDPESPGAFHGRDQVYHDLSQQEWPKVLAWLSALQPRAAALISPLSAFTQFSSSANGALSPEEFALASHGVASCTILRPLATTTLPSDASRVQRFMALWFSQFRWIFPHPSQSLLTKDVSAATMQTLQFEQAGVRVLSAQDMLPTQKATQ